MNGLPTLDPCPCCGGAAAWRGGFYGTHVHVECADCGLFTRERRTADAAAVAAAWNRRAEREAWIAARQCIRAIRAAACTDGDARDRVHGVVRALTDYDQRNHGR